MKIELPYGNEVLSLNLAENCIIYKSNYAPIQKTASELMLESIANPVGGNALNQLIKNKKTGMVVIVVSDITRPIPYAEFLPQMATGMHRSSTPAEHLKMFGEFVVKNYRIVDHNCENEDELQELDGRSWSGAKVRLNKLYIQAGFRIVTGLVEPHFMAGFSGGRIAICPGLVALNAVQKFHGYTFLSHPNASSTVLKDNPCHEENSSIARLCAPDFAINIVLDKNKKVNAVVSGDLFDSHQKTIEYVKVACCPVVSDQADVAITSSGGYPLDATFYQCVKGFVNCLPTVKDEGEIISFGSCIEGIGSAEYRRIMFNYAENYRQFIEDIKENRFFIKDQWQFQMHIRALAKVSQHNLHFYTSNIPLSDLSMLSVNPHSLPFKEIENSIQIQINKAIKSKKQIAIFPEGPYCSPTIY